MGMREDISKQYILGGEGIEIGGLHYPLWTNPGVQVSYVDVAPMEELGKLHPDVTPKELPIIVDNAETLDSFQSGTLDFVIANHVFEHCEDVVNTLNNWLRVLKPQGLIYAAIPDKRFTFDRDRSVTTLQHILNETDHVQDSRLDHYRDWYQNATMEKRIGQALEDAITTAYNGHQNIHWHVWDNASMQELFIALAKMLPFKAEGSFQNGSEVIWIFRKNA